MNRKTGITNNHIDLENSGRQITIPKVMVELWVSQSVKQTTCFIFVVCYMPPTLLPVNMQSQKGHTSGLAHAQCGYSTVRSKIVHLQALLLLLFYVVRRQIGQITAS